MAAVSAKTRGKKKGQLRGQLLFVLKDSVTIQGTDALAKGVEEMGGRASQILSDKIVEALS